MAKKKVTEQYWIKKVLDLEAQVEVLLAYKRQVSANLAETLLDNEHLAREVYAWRYLEDLLTCGEENRRRQNEGRAWQLAYEAVENTDKKQALLGWEDWEIVDSDKYEGREQLRRGGRPKKS